MEPAAVTAIGSELLDGDGPVRICIRCKGNTQKCVPLYFPLRVGCVGPKRDLEDTPYVAYCTWKGTAWRAY